MNHEQLFLCKIWETNLRRLGEQSTQILPGVYWGGDLKRAISNSVLDNEIKCRVFRSTFIF
jgi:hypothetical protein